MCGANSLGLQGGMNAKLALDWVNLASDSCLLTIIDKDLIVLNHLMCLNIYRTEITSDSPVCSSVLIVYSWHVFHTRNVFRVCLIQTFTTFVKFKNHHVRFVKKCPALISNSFAICLSYETFQYICSFYVCGK